MSLNFVADYTATDFSRNPGRALDAAGQGAVRVRRRGEAYVLLHARYLEKIIQDASDPRPKRLEDLLTGDDAEIKAGMKDWLADDAAGKEVL